MSLEEVEEHKGALTWVQSVISSYSQVLGDFVSLIHCILHFLLTPFATLINWIPWKREEKKLKPMGASPPDVLEVWFAGTHCGRYIHYPLWPMLTVVVPPDVGGGNAADEAKHDEYSPALANIPLRWMISELYDADKKYNLNIRWRARQLPFFGIRLPSILDIKVTGLDPDYLPLVLDDEAEPQPAEPQPDPLDLPLPATFTCTKTDKNGALIDLEFHNADLKQEIQSEMWRWNGVGPIIKMFMWWSFEFIPFMTYYRNKVTEQWESRPR